MELRTHNQLLRVDLEQGAAISHLDLVNSNGEIRTIIKPNEEFKFESSLLFPFPNRLENGRYQFEGKSYEFPINDFGRPNALHGMVHDMPFVCSQKQEHALELKLDYTGSLAYYPFPFTLHITYTLVRGKLTIKVKLVNTGEGSMPCGFGWHPYFHLGDYIEQANMRMTDVMRVEVDDLAIPTGKVTPFHTFETLSSFAEANLDNCFVYGEGKKENSTYLVYEDKSVLDVWQDHEQPFVQVFIHPNRKAIAIEPMTCGINALNTGHGLRILSAGESWEFSLGLRYT